MTRVWGIVELLLVYIGTGGGGALCCFSNVGAISVDVMFIHDNLSLTGEVLECKCGVRQVVKV